MILKDAYPTPQLHIYSAKLVFQVRFHGLRYLIYNHRVLAFIVFTGLFYNDIDLIAGSCVCTDSDGAHHITATRSSSGEARD
jgi:hypothetical protein